jgi:hypothetical protein
MPQTADTTSRRRHYRNQFNCAQKSVWVGYILDARGKRKKVKWLTACFYGLCQDEGSERALHVRLDPSNRLRGRRSGAADSIIEEIAAAPIGQAIRFVYAGEENKYAPMPLP